ncbi:MAG: hypothetical protein ACKOXK_10105 [Chakrabartia sp.]
MKKSVIVMMFATIALAGAAQARPKPIPEAKPVGKPLDCISLSQIQESRVRSDSIIDFRLAGHKWVRNTLPNSCPSLGFEERFSYHTSLSQLCSVDTIAVLHSYGGGLQEGARCGLGKFQPVELSGPGSK